MRGTEMTVIRATVGVIALAGAVAVTTQAADQGNLRAGASRVDYTKLTPQEFKTQNERPHLGVNESTRNVILQ